MGKKIATLYAEITADTSKVQRGITDTKKGLSGLASSFKSVTGISLGATAVFGAMAKVLNDSIRAAQESERAQAVTSATLKATGRNAKITTEEIANLALNESRLTSIDDEVVQGGVNMLLTFKGLGEETLPRATKAMEDMAVAMAGGDTSAIDLKGTAIQLGKALNDPLVGLTALKRVGVTFSDSQKQQIENFMAVNDLASAQAVILTELENEFGGLSAAMGETAEGGVNKLKNEWNNLLETMGQPIVQGRNSLLGVLTQGLANTNSTTSLATQVNKLYAANKITSKQAYQAMQGLAGGDQSVAQGLVDDLYASLSVMSDAASNTFITSWVKGTTEAFIEEVDAVQAAKDALSAYEDALSGVQDIQGQITDYKNTTGGEIQGVMGKWLYEDGDRYIEGLKAIDEVMGTTLYKEKEHADAVKELAEEYSRTGDIDAFKTKMEELKDVETEELQEKLTDAANSAKELYAVWAAMQGLPTTLNWEVVFTQTGDLPEGLVIGKGGGGSRGEKKVLAAGGADFIVPPGYPNDSFGMGVQSGEHVTVTPAGQSGITVADLRALQPDYYKIGRIIGEQIQRYV